jgi:hypothetical protein
VTTSFKSQFFFNGVIGPEFDGLFFVLDVENNTMSVELFPFVVSLRLEVLDIIVEELEADVLIEFGVAKSS